MAPVLARVLAPVLLLCGGLAGGLVACSSSDPGADGPSEPLPTLHALPGFRAVDQDGQPFDVSSLQGKVWVANFIFTDCPSICPMLTAQMGNFQRRLGEDAGSVQLVSISVDPERDTPEVLKEYAERHRADLSSWRFLTLGDHAQTTQLLMTGFRVRMGAREEQSAGGYDIMHASHFVLVDGARHVRGYYRTDAEGLANLERDARRLLN